MTDHEHMCKDIISAIMKTYVHQKLFLQNSIRFPGIYTEQHDETISNLLEFSVVIVLLVRT